MHIKPFNYALVLLLFISTALIGQKTIVVDPPQSTYNRALTLFKEQNYGAAENMFRQFKQQLNDPSDVLYENASFYQTVASVRLQSKDALSNTRAFAAAYPESAKLPVINFELGNLLYGKRKYGEALEAYNRVSPRALDKTQKQAYFFKKGFCLMESDRLDAAYNSFAKVKDTKSNYSQPAFYYSAHIQYTKGKYPEALKEFKTLENSRKYGKIVAPYIIHIYYETEDYRKAIEEGQRFLKTADRKTKGEIAKVVANSYYNLNDYANAYTYFQVYESSAGKKIAAEEQYRIGYCKFVAKEYKAAIANFQKASHDNELYLQNAWYHLGFCYLNTGEPKFAQSAFLKAYREGDDFSLATDALYNYVKLTLELGNDPYNDPVEIVESFIRNNPGIPRISEAYDLLAQLYVTSKNYRGALGSIESSGNPNRKLQEVYQQIAFAQGIDYFNRGAYTDAISFFTKSLKYAPDKTLESKSVFWIADAYYRMKNFSDAAGMFKQFLSSPAASQSGLYPQGIYNYAYSLFNQKDYKSAATYFYRYLQSNATDQNMISDAKLRLADSYYITKNYELAATWYDKVIKNNTTGIDYALYQRAFCYGAQGDFNKKINTLKSLTSSYRNSSLYDDALYEIASTSLVLNDQRSAIVYFDKLVKELPKSSLAKKSLIKMGFVYYNNKQYDMGIKTLKKVVDTYPASIEATEAMNGLKNIYLDMGKVDQYFAYAKSLDFIQVSTSEEDSLTFVAGENEYFANNCSAAINALNDYLTKFPQGGFVLRSTYYLSKCYQKNNDPDKALELYLKIISYPDNQYTAEALLKAARIEFDRKKYEEAFIHYAKLAEVAEVEGMKIEGNDGAMRCAFLLHDYQNAKVFASALLISDKVTEEQTVYAHYILAKAAYENNNITTAEKEFELTDKLTSGLPGAEAKYMLANISFNANNLDKAEELIYQLPEQYADFEYWIAKGFILLADVYLKRDNAFQAEQTLQSILDNYPGDDLKKEAFEKLEEIRKSDTEQKEVNDSE